MADSARIALLIGSGRYVAEPELATLDGPANDVSRLATVLADEDYGRFDVRTFLDIESYQLLPDLEATLSEAKRGDLILLYYSGHGKLNFNGQLCLTTTNTRLDRLQSTSIPLPHLRSLIESSRSNRIVLVLDCCFSGAAAKAFVRSAADDQLKVAQEECGAGLHILTSATSVQTSHERDHEDGDDIMGEFTRTVIEGITSGEADLNGSGITTLSELREYVDARLKGQRPRYWGLEASGDIAIAYNPVRKAADLPEAVQHAIDNPLPQVRAGAVETLSDMLLRSNPGLRLAAREALEDMVEDDSRRVAAAAADALKTGEPGTTTDPGQDQDTTDQAAEEEQRQLAEKERLAAEAEERRQAEAAKKKKAAAQRKRRAESAKKRTAEAEAEAEKKRQEDAKAAELAADQERRRAAEADRRRASDRRGNEGETGGGGPRPWLTARRKVMLALMAAVVAITIIVRLLGPSGGGPGVYLTENAPAGTYLSVKNLRVVPLGENDQRPDRPMSIDHVANSCLADRVSTNRPLRWSDLAGCGNP